MRAGELCGDRDFSCSLIRFRLAGSPGPTEENIDGPLLAFLDSVVTED